MSLNKPMPAVATLAIAGVVLVATISMWGEEATEPQSLHPKANPAESTTSTRLADASSITRAPAGARSRQVVSQPFAPVEPAPEEQEQIMAAQVADLDQKLRADPFDPVWAREQEEIIAQALVGTPNDGLEVPLPDGMDASCHSTLCRIQMTYADEEDAMQMHTKLTLGLNGAIATARTFYRPNQSGGMDLVVFAGAVN